MSDDGYYGNSGMDEFDDMLDDADPTPDLADDLAEHSAPSPVWFDEPGYDLMICHSDWEYYSDDYFDDDPAIMKKQKTEESEDSGNKSEKRPKMHNQQQRGKKRKHGEAEEEKVDDRPTLRDCIKGTVWTRPQAQSKVVYAEGELEKVALLPDWRKLLGENIVRNREAPKLQTLDDDEDESWAKDMSLKDMGLQPQRSRSFEVQPNQDEDAESTNSELDVAEEDGEAGGSLNEGVDVNQSVQRSTTDVPSEASLPGHMIQVPPPSEQELEDEQSKVLRGRKKRRLNSGLLSPSTSNDSKIAQAGQSIKAPPPAASPTRSTLQKTVKSLKTTAKDQPPASKTSDIRGAKRKAADVEEEHDEDVEPKTKRLTRRSTRNKTG